MQNRQNNILIGFTFFTMVLLGVLESIRGALIPSIQGFYGIEYSDIGNFLLVASLGYVTANFLGGSIADSIGQKKLVLLGVIFTAVGILGMAVSNRYIIFLVAVIILNYGYGSISIGLNTLTPVVFKNNQGMMLNLLHFFYGLGATFGPRYAGVALNLNWTWQKTYTQTIFLLGIYVAFLLVNKFPKVEVKHASQKVPLMEIVRNRKVMLYSFVFGFYVAAELAIANWLTTYLQSVKSVDSLKSATYLSLFFGVFTFGRLIGGLIVEKLGYFRSIIGFLIAALILFISGTIATDRLIILISISGFFFSIIYPTIFALMLKEFDKGASAVIGVVITISSAINMIGNRIIGQVNDVFGAAVGFRLVALYLIITIGLILILKKSTEFEENIKSSF